MHISLLIFLAVPYLVIISLFIFGWFRTPSPRFNQELNKPFVSILIPLRNEAENLPRLIKDLISQSYPLDKFEIIFIDDHSTDNTVALIHDYQDKYELVKSISLKEKSGKKAAIWEGIQQTKGDLILTTDGDCRFTAQWVETMVNYYQHYPHCLLIGPVFMEQKKGILNQFQSLEFLSLIASGAGAAGINRPILCNGANLGASRSLFLKAEEVYNSSIASGDDIFLLLELKKRKVPVTFVKDEAGVVITKNSTHLKQFFKQRTRWTFKSRYYRDFDIIFTALVVLFTNVFMLSLLVYVLIQPKLFITFLIFYLLKCFVDYILLYNVARFFKRSRLLRLFFVHQLLYVLYVSFVGIAGHFLGEKWKK